jgi:hypothetical protein
MKKEADSIQTFLSFVQFKVSTYLEKKIAFLNSWENKSFLIYVKTSLS